MKYVLLYLLQASYCLDKVIVGSRALQSERIRDKKKKKKIPLCEWIVNLYSSGSFMAKRINSPCSTPLHSFWLMWADTAGGSRSLCCNELLGGMGLCGVEPC